MRVLAICVVYQPQPELLLRSVASYADAVDKVLIWQNSPISESLEDRMVAIWGDERGRVEFRGDGSNVGIAVALNVAWREAVAGGYDAVLTMDQDSVWHAFGSFIEAVNSPDAPAGFFAPRILSKPGIEDREATGKKAIAGESTTTVFAPFDTAFTSGMLVPVQVLEKVGGWCEDFKVDGIDNEFCLHARSLGIQGYRVSSGWLEHALGKVVIKRLFGLRFRTYNYTPDRLFGIYRNNLIAIKKYPSVSRNFRHEFYRTWLWRRPLRMLLGERDLKAKFAAIRRGIRAARKAEI